MKGGAVEALLKPPTPMRFPKNTERLKSDIRTADDVIDQTDIYYVSCHGSTDITNYFTVPQATFLVFLGYSGFVRFAGQQGFRGLSQLLSQHSFPGATDPERLAAWKEKFFENFYSGTNTDYKGYEGAQIYVPGDLLNDNELNFTSVSSQTLWPKGVYPLPIENRELLQNLLIPRNHNYIIQLLIAQKKGLISIHQIENAEWQAENRPAQWEGLVNLSESVIPIITTTPYNTVEYWFKHPERLNEFTTSMEMRYDDSILSTQAGKDFLLPEDYKTHLSTLVYTVESKKGYTFWILGMCRGVQGIPHIYPEPQYERPDPRNLPTRLNTRILQSRRASFSAKSDLAACSIHPTPPMNLYVPAELLSRALSDPESRAQFGVLLETDLGDIAAFQYFIYSVIPLVFDVYEGKVPHTDAPFSEYNPRNQMTAPDLAIFLSWLPFQFKVLTTKRAEFQAFRAAFQEFLNSARAAFGTFLKLNAIGSTAEDQKALTLGNQLLKLSRLASHPMALSNAHTGALKRATEHFLQQPALKEFETTYTRRKIRSFTPSHWASFQALTHDPPFWKEVDEKLKEFDSNFKVELPALDTAEKQLKYLRELIQRVQALEESVKRQNSTEKQAYDILLIHYELSEHPRIQRFIQILRETHASRMETLRKIQKVIQVGDHLAGDIQGSLDRVAHKEKMGAVFRNVTRNNRSPLRSATRRRVVSSVHRSKKVTTAVRRKQLLNALAFYKPKKPPTQKVGKSAAPRTAGAAAAAANSKAPPS